MDPKAHVASRLYPVNSTRDAAAMNITPSQKHFMHPDIVYAQRYSNYKALGNGGKVFPFTNLNVESVLIPANLLQLWAQARGAHGRSNNIEKLVSIVGKQSYLEQRSDWNLHIVTLWVKAL